MVEGDAHSVGEVLAEDGDLGVTLAEVVQHDEVGVHLHPDADGLRRGAVGARAVPEYSRGEKRDEAFSFIPQRFSNNDEQLFII